MNWREGGNEGRRSLAVSKNSDSSIFAIFYQIHMIIYHDMLMVAPGPHLEAPKNIIQMRIGDKTEAASVLALSCVDVSWHHISIYINYHDNRIRDTTVAS